MSHIDSGLKFQFLQGAQRVAPRNETPSYFHDDCAFIVDAAQRDANALPGIAALVLCSIQQPFHTVATQLQDVARNGLTSRYLFGSKRDGLAYVMANRRELHAVARAVHGGDATLDDAVLAYLAIPGLGIVKASFLAQMTVGNGACLDLHNLARLGLAESAFKTPKALKVDTIRARIRSYRAVWESIGDSAYWWDSWCDHVAAVVTNSAGRKVNHGFTDGAHVSRYHRLAITAGVK